MGGVEMNNNRIKNLSALLLAGMLLFGGISAYAAEPTENVTQSGTQTPAVSQTSVRPDAPTLGSVKKTAYNRFVLAWSKVPKASGYYVYRKEEGKSFKRIATVKGNKTFRYTDKTFVCNTKYTYMVKAYRKTEDGIIKSKNSNSIEKISKYKGMQQVNNCIYYFDKHHKCYRKVDGSKKMICLTYDDGPSANTASILKTLKKYDSVATFFIVGNRAASYKSTVKQIQKQHCQIGSHTYSHATLTRLSSAGIKKEMSKTDSAIKKITGQKPTIMRPPGGSYNKTVRNSVGKPILYWSVDTRDWATRSSSKTIRAVLDNAKDGDIVLMHDLYESTASASRTIIPKLVDRGYQLVTIDEMAALRGGMKNGSVYSSFRK